MPSKYWFAFSVCLGLTAPLAAEELRGPMAATEVALPKPIDCPPACPETACETLCGPPGRVWASAEWLYAVSSGDPLPPLATASTAGTPRTSAGVLGTPGTTTVIGGRRANNDFRNGLRANAGLWLDPQQLYGVEADFLFLTRSRDQSVAGAADGSQIVSRPFVNAITGLPDAELVSFPGVLAGTVTVRSSSDVIGGGVNLLCNHCCSPCGRFDWVGGFRYLNLRDDLAITENLTALAGSGQPAGSSIVVNDRFRTTNNFYGGTIGGRYEQRFGRLYVAARGSVALGVSHQDVTIAGSTTITPPGGVPSTLPGGLLAQTSNIGRYSSDEFAVIPEGSLRLGVQLTNNARLYVGYTFVYWSNVARAGDQIDPRVNTNLIPPATAVGGPALPAVRLTTTDYWLQGVSIGGEFRF